jgi:3-isopropylmalate/(R)-2-methylmalate dehydratase large subunit
LVDQTEGQPDLLYVDRHLIHEVTSNQAFETLRAEGRRLRRPDLTCGVIDHSIPTDDRRRPLKDKTAEAQLAALEKNHKDFGFKVFFGDTDPRQGVVHVVMPEEGLILPGHSVVCGDSHTATHGALGALAFGIGTSEVGHVLATQTIYQEKPKNLEVRLLGSLPYDVSAKDLILYIISVLGVSGGTGYALEYSGKALKSLSMDSRFTLSNMSIECGAKIGLIAPDEITFKYLKGRPFAPRGKAFLKAVLAWKELFTHPDFEFDKVLNVNLTELSPRVTWGTNPAQNVPLGGKIPRLETIEDEGELNAAINALTYHGLQPGLKISEIPVDYVFIGSCTNGRYEDLKEAAEVFQHHKVKAGVTVLVVPGSGPIKQRAEAEGLDQIFLKAGCQWRESGCSMCLAMNPDLVPPGNRCVSASNRNFEGRQGRMARTHLASPSTAAASAVAGRIIPVSSIERFV